MERSQSRDLWTAGSLYEPYVGRWSRLVARELLRWLLLPAGKDWLDVGSGTGALTRIILEDAFPNLVTAIDPSAGFVEYAETQIATARVSFKIGDARALPINSASFDAVVSGLVLNFVPEPQLAVAEMVRVVRPGGMVAAYVWDYAGKMELMRYFWDAALALDPAAHDLDEGRRFPICLPSPLAKLFIDAGLQNVEVRGI